MLTLVPLLLLAAFFIFLPLLSMIKDSFTMPEVGGFTLDNYKTILTDSIYIVATKNSLYLSTISAIIGLIISFFIAYSVNEIGQKGQNRILSVLNMVSNFAGLPLYFAFVVILGNTGIFVLALRAIGIPVLLPSLLDTFGLLFANAITAYATVILLVTTSIPLLPVKITTMFTGEMTPQKEMGSALAIWMIFLMLLVIFICNFLKKRLYKGGQ